jgi:FixJ family two-component response regulator
LFYTWLICGSIAEWKREIISMSDAKNINVAIVDDDASLCHAMERLLRAAGFQSFTYRSAEAFLLDGGRARLDCILLDIQLGGMSGFELQNQLANSGCATPVIFITAYDDPEAREQARQTNCIAYLRKNDPGEAVLDAIRKAIHLDTVKV